MKKIITLAAAITIVASMAYAASNEVYSVNVVGFQKKELPPGGAYILTACNFETGSSNTLLSIFGTNTLVQDNNYAACDRVMIYDPATQTYQAWAQWTDGVFYKANDPTEWNAGIAGNPEVPVGEGFFITSSGSATTTNTITYVGDVVMAETQSTTIVEGYQIISYPFSSDIPLQDTKFFADGAAADNNYAACDRVHIYENGAYQAYAVWTDGQWYKANDPTEWNAGILATNDLKVGEGFFYEAQGAITWTETNKYLQSIQN
jgi:hypothetical protein